MPKINQEEYKFLKNLDDKWKWIARDSDNPGKYFTNSLEVYTDKPEKLEDRVWTNHNGSEKLNKDFFQFIQWEDEEPHNIAELIEEYENKEFYDYVGWKYAESEEAEMNKDIQWLKEEVLNQNLINKDGYIYAGNLTRLLNQLDEPEVKQLERKIKELDSYNDELIRDNNQLREALDNQEVLTQEWIDDNSVYASSDGVTEEYVHVDELKEILVPRQELPVVPTWFDEWWKYATKGGGNLFHNIERFYDELFSSGTRETYDYISGPDNKKKLLNIIINELDYVVEEEQKYIVSDNSSIPLLIKNDSGEIMSYDSQIAYNNSNGTIELTEQEIKDYDERYMTFAKPVVVCN